MEKNDKQNNSKNIIIETNTDNEEMTIKIQTLDNIFPLVVKKSATVGELKEKIFEVKYCLVSDAECAGY